MSVINIGIIMNGVTGRMGRNQHLARTLGALRAEGGLELPNGDRLVPEPLLVGRSEAKLRELAEEHGIQRWRADPDLEECLEIPDYDIYFDAQITSRRREAVTKALAAGKHVYCEKPLADNLEDALELVSLANESGLKNGIVQDKLWLPGFRKLRRLVEAGFFGRILSVKLEFGYWVFSGHQQEANRPAWNYRAEEGGGIILDMFPHWRYILDNIIAPVRAVCCRGARHLPERVDEDGPYEATADDAAYALLELEGGIITQVSASWTTRVYRDELVELQVDGTEGSAIAGLRQCRAQHHVNTPKPVWNPDEPNPHDFYADWQEVPDNQEFENPFRAQWELFLRHVVLDESFQWDFLEGAKGVQLAEAALQSWEDRRWIDVPDLSGELA